MAAALLGGVLLLTGCTGSSGSDSAAPEATSPSPDASVTAQASASRSPSALPSDSAASPSATAPPSSPRSTAPATTSPSTRPAPASVPGCRNLTVSGEVKAAVTRAYQRGFPRFVHIEPEPQRFFFGQCGTVRYAATQFQPTKGATEGELVNLQDEGSAMKYFRATSGTNWTYIATDGFPASESGCRAIPQIPRALATAWRNCAVAR